jgi:transcriptional regulator with XRE-family HTH domain
MLKPKLPNPVDKHVGTRVRTRRQEMQMTQTQLGDALDLTFQQVQKYEKGTNRIGASRLSHIAQILKCDISYFYDGAPINAGSKKGNGKDHALSPLTEFCAHRNAADLAANFMKLSAKLQARVTDLVEEMAADV